MKQHIMNVVLVHGAFADGSGWEASLRSSRMMDTKCRAGPHRIFQFPGL